RHVEYQRFCFDVVERKPTGASTIKTVTVRWSFFKSGNGPSTGIQLDPGESINVRINDNLTALTDHTFNFQGYYA
ncbi:MAG: hypothetical protein ACYTEQ_29755, partial [Planctomycetota bacterium]